MFVHCIIHLLCIISTSIVAVPMYSILCGQIEIGVYIQTLYIPICFVQKNISSSVLVIEICECQYFEVVSAYIRSVSEVCVLTFVVRSTTVVVDVSIVQGKVYLSIDEPGLVFVKCTNRDDKVAHRIYIAYTIFPSALSISLEKIQCFCFEQIIVPMRGSIYLPILVRLTQMNIAYTVMYTFICIE